MNNEIPIPRGKFKSVGINNLAEVIEHEIAVKADNGVTTHTLKFRGGGTATIHVSDDGLFDVAAEGLDAQAALAGESIEILLSVPPKDLEVG
jgi:hypothetical protein